MTIPKSEIVQVSIAVAPTAVPTAGFGSLLFLTDETSSNVTLSQRIKKYATLSGVTDDFSADSEVVKAATTFYGQSPQPLTFYVGLVNATASAGSFVGTPADSLVNLQNITAGGFKITVDGSEQTITGLDLSLAADEAAVATTLASAISGVTVTYVDSGFTIASASTGANSSIATPTEDVGGALLALGWTVGNEEPGLDSESAKEGLIKCFDMDFAPYGVAIHKKWRDTATALEVANYIQGHAKLFLHTTNDANTLKQGDLTCMASQIASATLGRTITCYSSHTSEYPEVSLAGRAFTVNFEGTNTTITLFLKQMPGISVERLTTSQKGIIEEKNANAVVSIAGVNVFTDSKMADGSWFDTRHGTDWLTDRIQTDLFNLYFQSNTKIPGTSTGVNINVATLANSLNQGVNNGLIAPGNDALGEFMPEGYRITALPYESNADRVYRGMSFEAAGAGALQGVVVSGSFKE